MTKSCKDCLHLNVCGYRQTMDIGNGYAEECNHFKDRSRFVELPCKVGNRLYVLFPKNKYIAEYVVTAFWVEEADVIIRIVDTRFFTTNILFTRDIGTKAFLTKKEAEQALKERKKR